MKKMRISGTILMAIVLTCTGVLGAQSGTKSRGRNHRTVEGITRDRADATAAEALRSN
jgi:hypothetical protein